MRTRCFSRVLQATRDAGHTAPTFVPTQADGSGSPFALLYYSEPGFLTRTSQPYLETQLPILGDCFAIQPSFRVEEAQTHHIA